MIIVRNQNPATLECEVEAFPEPIVYWERGDGRRLKMTDRYRMDVYDRRDIYKVILFISAKISEIRIHRVILCALS